MRHKIANKIVVLSVLLALTFSAGGAAPAQAAGIYTHSVFVDWARIYLKIYDQQHDEVDYSELLNILKTYPDTVNYGASFPDTTFGGIDPDWAEVVHDTTDTRDNYTNYLQFLKDKKIDRSDIALQTSSYRAFLEDPNYTAKIPVYRAALMRQMGQYFNASPRSFEDEKKIAFLFGLIAHQEADLAWHWTPDPNWVPLEKAAKDLYGKTADYNFEIFTKSFHSGHHAEFTYASYIEQDVLAASDAISYRSPHCWSFPCPAGLGDPITAGAYNQALMWDELPAWGADWNSDSWIWSYVPGGIYYGSALVAGAWMQTWDWFKATPITEILLSSAKPAGGDKWYQGPVNITLKAGACFSGMDTTIGPCQTYYKLNSDTNFQKYTNPIQISSQGTTNLYYYSVDAKNSEEVHRQATIKIDLTSPTITAAATIPPNAVGWYNRDVRVHFTCSDSLSGIPNSACPTDQVLSGEGTAVQSTVQTVNDAVGNVSSLSNTISVKIDKTAPTILAAVTKSPDKTGWYKGNVKIHFICSDTLSGIPKGACPPDQVLRSEGTTVQSTAQAVTDTAGNIGTSSTVTVKIDKSAPTLNPAISPNPVLLNSGATATANASDALSGVASQSCGRVDTRTPGKHTVTCTATDHVGNTTTQTISYTVNYGWDGFLPSVDTPPTVNTGKAGMIYPVMWQLTDANGTFISDLSAIRTPGVYAVQCGSFSSNPTSTLESSKSNRAGLRYDRAANQFIYNWSTPTNPGCYKLVIKLKGGQLYPVYFNLK